MYWHLRQTHTLYHRQFGEREFSNHPYKGKSYYHFVFLFFLASKIFIKKILFGKKIICWLITRNDASLTNYPPPPPPINLEFFTKTSRLYNFNHNEGQTTNRLSVFRDIQFTHEYCGTKLRGIIPITWSHWVTLLRYVRI